MKALVLSDDLLTGIDEIDIQHREIFNWGNAILSPENGELTNDLFMDGLLFLRRYTGYHFLAEEQVMMELNYAQLKNHQLQHKIFQSDVQSVYERAHADGASKGLISELYYLLSDWFTYHIKIRDQDFSRAVREEGGTLSSITLPPLESLIQKLDKDYDLKDIDDITVSYSK